MSNTAKAPNQTRSVDPNAPENLPWIEDTQWLEDVQSQTQEYPGKNPKKPRKNPHQNRPLSLQLVLITVILLSLALLFSGIFTVTLLRTSLINKVDEELTNSGPDIARQIITRVIRDNHGFVGSLLPSEYYMMFVLPDGKRLVVSDNRQEANLGHPLLDTLGSSTKDLLKKASTPVTVTGSNSHNQWRTLAFGVSYSGINRTEGVVVISLPLRHIARTSHAASELMTIASFIIIALTGMASWVSVRRSLRPLREIDRTAQKIASGDLAQRIPLGDPNTEVGTLARSLNQMLVRIEEAFRVREASDARMRQFAADASHEIRTPLATVRGYAELYRLGGIKEADMPEAMKRIESEAQRMGLLVEDLLQLARLDQGRPIQPSKVDIVEVARHALGDFSVRQPGRSTEILGQTKMVVTTDQNLIHQVLTNLLTNVAQHTPPNTPVEIWIGQSADNNFALVDVCDHGPGIAPGDNKKVFERFYRSDKSRSRESGGSGIGLAIVRQIMVTLDGKIEALTTPGGGLTMRLSLPLQNPTSPAGPIDSREETEETL